MSRLTSFNEAGADAPEIRARWTAWRPPSLRFNEAGADAPEIHTICDSLVEVLARRFNEAGADAPEIRQWEVVARDAGLASMRPGRMPRKYNSLIMKTTMVIRLQ